MDTRFLESFLIVAESGSIAEAARRMNISPAAVAKRLHAIEAELGLRLITRAGRTTGPTEAGYAILERVRQLLRDARDLSHLASADMAAGQLRIGVIGTAGTGVLPSILDYIARECPGIDLYIVPGTSADLHRRVIDRDLDAAIIVEPPFSLGKDCDWMLLRAEPLMLITPPSLEEADIETILRNENFIRYDRAQWGGRLADAYLHQLNIRPRERIELDALDAIAVLVDRGLGVSLVPEWAPPWPEGLRIRRIAIGDDAFVRRIGLIWLRNSPSVRQIKTFRQHARTALGL